MAETKHARLEERVEQLEKDLGEARGVISRLSGKLTETMSTVGALNREVSDLKLALKQTQDWAKGQGKPLHDNGITRYE